MKLSDIPKFWKWKNEIVEHNKKGSIDDSILGWNVYVPANTTRKEFAKQFYKVHGKFKYRFLVPLLIIARKFFLPKYKHEGVVAKDDYNREWVVFERAFNLALEDMAVVFYHKENTKNNISAEEARRIVRENDSAHEYLKTMKQMTLYVSTMDTAYHEFGAFLMHRIASEMQHEFHGETYNRVAYDNRQINDIHWFVIQKQLNTQTGELHVDVKKMLEANNYAYKQEEVKNSEEKRSSRNAKKRK